MTKLPVAHIQVASATQKFLPMVCGVAAVMFSVRAADFPISLTAPDEVAERSLPIFARAIEQARSFVRK